MASIEDEKVDANVRESLKGTVFESSSLQRLSGGIVNWGYRATLAVPLPDGTTEVFLKHGERWVAKIPDFEVNLVRCRVEAQVLRYLTEHPIIGNAGVADSHKFTVKTPRLLNFDQENTIQVHEYLPTTTTLKAFVLENYAAPASETKEHECRQLGKAIGGWLNEFVKSTASQPDMRRCAEENAEAQAIRHKFSYGWIPDRIKEYPGMLDEAKEILEGVFKMATEELEDKSMLQVVHGDLAPANIVVRDEALKEHQDTAIVIIDWEVMHMNHKHFDVSQMAVDTYLLWKAKGSRAGIWILEGLIAGSDGIDEELAFRIATHMGSFLVCMMPLSPDWGPPEKIEELVRLGRDIMVHAWNKDRAWFENGELACLFKGVP